MKRLLTTALLVVCSISFSQNTNSLWRSSSRNSNSNTINKTGLPLKHLFDLDFQSLKNKLASSPKRNASKNTSNTIIALPNGDGAMENFSVFENEVMAPELAAKYPEIKSYIAIGIDNPRARAYFSSSPLGFKSMILYPDQSAVFMEPVTDDLNTYTLYKKSDKEASLDTFECSVVDYAIGKIQKTTNTRIAYRGADDGKLRTFRLALSCTAEYAAYFGGTKAGALAGINNTLTRINGVFEKDFGVQLILIANNDSVIYTDPLTDPYSDYTSKANWRSELKTNLNTTIGLSNYDIGHLFGMSGINASSGDAGCIGCVCSDFNKGAGYTCANPTLFSGDTFDIDFVAHEMGHQLGANHTFTYVNDNPIAQIEPGSGSTIMSYSGSTTKDVQVNSDAYFHAISIQQVTDNIKTKTCSILIATGNAVPVVNAGLDYSIPIGTPFMLTGAATDANSDDALTYAWEEMDLGNATTTVPSASAITGPLFRSYSSSTSAVRYFPNMNTILAGSTTTSGLEIPVEVLPGVARTLNFRLTVRDNRAGGSANNTDDMVISVDGNSGPFTVDSQNSAVSYPAGTVQTINWTVAGTNANGVNCANVDILLSTDGGKTFSITLLSGTPNTGSAQVAIPNIPGTANRIMVKGTNQIFFDVNNLNFTITGSGAIDTIAPTAATLSASGATTSSTDLSWTAATDNVGVAGYNVYQNGVLKTSTAATSLAVSGLSASTAYAFYIVAKDAAGNWSAPSNTVNVTTLTPADTAAPTASTLSASGITNTTADLNWTAATDNLGVAGYNVYQNGVLKTTTSATSLAVSGLSASTAYSFYIVATDDAGNGSAPSNTLNVTTLTPADTAAPTASTLSASGITTATADLTWTAATDNLGVTGYDLYQNGVLKTTTTATSLTVNGLSAATAYSFYIVAKDAAGNGSAPSNTLNVTTLTPADTTAPTASTLSASGITTTSADLSWNAATDNIGVAGYNVYQNGVLTITTSATSLTVNGLSAATAYSFYIVAKDAAGNLSSASNTVNATTLSLDTTLPSAATLSASGVTAISTDLFWNTATGKAVITGYNVYQNGLLKTTTTTTSFSISGLSALTSYSFYIVSIDANGNWSAPSNTVYVTTLSAPDTSAPSSSTLSASMTTTSSTDLSWTKSTDNVGVIGYDVYQNGVLKTTTTATSFAVSGLSASTFYNFYIVAKDATGNLSVASNTVNVTTIALADTIAPTVPTLSASGTTTSSINLSWIAATDNVGVAGYTIYQNGVLKTTTTATSLAIAGLTALTGYSFYVVAKDAAGNLSVSSNTVNVTTLATTIPNTTLAYCSSYGSSTAREYINKVQIGSITNISGNNNGFGDFTTMSTDLAIGTTNTIIITPTWTGSYLYETFSVWIDFNQDGDFNDIGELAYSKPKSKSKFKSVSGYLNIPTTALTGSTRMRVSMKNNTLPNSCENFSYGEVEDYTVNITGSTARPENTEVAAVNMTEDKPKDTKRSLIVYPNPVKGDVLNILNLEKPSDFRIFNLMGQELGSNHIENDSVYLGTLQAGVYLIEITDGTSTTTKQFIKE